MPTKIISLLCILFIITTARAEVLNDNGGISATPVTEFVHVHHMSDILNAIQKAKQLHLPIAIAAVQHSQGGQTLIRNGIVLDMLPYHRVLQIDQQKMQVTVEPGITWTQLQHAINPYHLAVGVMQTSDIFSVGGSMSVNAHGLDFKLSPIINTIVSFHLILADGKIVMVSPTQNPTLWRAMIGGYGLLGVIKDVTLQLVPNDNLRGHVIPATIANFYHEFTNKVLANKNAALFLGRLSISPNNTLLNDGLILTFTNTHQLSRKIIPLKNPDNMDFLMKPIFNWARHSDLGKRIMWRIEVITLKLKYNHAVMSRNNAMRFAIKFAVDHHVKNHADWLQEYFLPPKQLAAFVNFFRAIVIQNKINLLNATIRYTQGNAVSVLNYSKKPTFSLVIYFDQSLSQDQIEKARHWTRLLIDKAHQLGGNYYLPYQDFATKNQFQENYLGYREFLAIKQQYDPANLFQNEFSKRYCSVSIAKR